MPSASGSGVNSSRLPDDRGSMAERRYAHAPFNILGATMFDRENVDQVDEFEMVLDAADIDMNLAAADV